MGWDVAVSVALALVAWRMAWLGVHVTLHTPQEEAKKKRHKQEFVVLGALMIILILVQGIRNGLSQKSLRDQLAKIQVNTETPPKVEVNVPPSVPPNIIVNPPTSPTRRVSGGFIQFLGNPHFLHGGQLAPKVQMDVNLYLVNRGTEPVDGFYRYFSIAVGPVGNDPDKEDRTVRSIGHKDALKNFQSMMKTSPKGITVNPGEAVWNTLSFTPGNQEVVDAIMNGTSRLYVYVWARWEGENHHLEDCKWLQAPATPEITDNAVWHMCAP